MLLHTINSAVDAKLIGQNWRRKLDRSILILNHKGGHVCYHNDFCSSDSHVNFFGLRISCKPILGDVMTSEEEIYGASAHSDCGVVTPLATDGVPGLQSGMTY